MKHSFKSGLALTSACAFLVTACLRFSPFEVDLDENQRDVNRKSIAKLRASDRQPISEDSPCTFAFISDTHDGYENFSSIVSEINRREEIEFVLHGGDITDFGAQQEYVWAWEIFRELKVPFIAVAGNHDGLSTGRDIYGQMFGPTDFWFDYGGLRFVAYNSNTIEWDLSEPRFDRLERAVEDPPGPLVFFSHQPPGLSPHFTEEATEKMRDFFEPLDVLVYLFGHVHEKFTEGKFENVPLLKTQAALDGGWLLVTIDGRSVTAEACVLETCGEAAIEEEEER